MNKSQIEAVTNTAHQWHMTTLERYGNKPNDTQRTILRELLRMLAEMAAGQTVGRYPWPLATGLGKTTAVIAFHHALEALHIKGVSTAIAATQVEALCRLYRELRNAGVPEAKIGLIHAKKFDGERYKVDDAYASEPCTDDNENRPYMLVTQERVKTRERYDEYFKYRGKPRQLMIWDESLIATEYWKLSLNSFIGAKAGLSGMVEGEGCTELAEFYTCFKEYTDLLKNELAIAKESGKTRYITPPSVPLEKVAEWTALAKSREFRQILHNGTLPSLTFLNQKMRVYPLKDIGGLVFYTPTIPDKQQMPSMVILDASFPIRELEQADGTLSHVEEHVKAFSDGVISFDEVKRYNAVTIHQWCKHSGREAMRKDFFGDKSLAKTAKDEWLAELRAERSVVKSVVKVAASLPEDEAILFFVFKPQQTSQDNYRKVLEETLHKAGVDLHGTITVEERNQDGTKRRVKKPRICVLTYGQETSLNDYAHCSNVFLVGILHREELDVLGQYVATCDGGDHEHITNRTAQELVQSEVVHTIYQALSRGTCRVTENGQAKPMKAWILHYSKGIRRALDRVMPGAVWRNSWETSTGTVTTKPRDPGVVELREYLEGLLPEEFPVLIKDVKAALGMGEVSKKVWRRTRSGAIEGTPFKVNEQTHAFIIEPGYPVAV